MNRKFLLLNSFVNFYIQFSPDFEDIKLMLQHILEDRKVTTDMIEKQLGLLDVLFQHRLQHVDASVVKEEAAKSMYIFSYQQADLPLLYWFTDCLFICLFVCLFDFVL